jgi:ABC-2 type transport system ATP-binding protein
MFFARLFNFNENSIRERVDRLLELVDMAHVANRPVGEFSKGMARRIGLAQSLINDPDLIILDEPTSGLDPIACYKMKNIIKELGKKGKTIIISSHLLADIEDLCSRICILYNGRILAQGSLQELLEQEDKIRFSLTVRTAEEVSKAEAVLKDIFGHEPVIDRPRVTLERFFFDIVSRQKQNTERIKEVQSTNQDSCEDDK